MHSTTRWTLMVAASTLALLGCAGGTAQQDGGPQQMTFFLTSVNPGKGGDLGGLAGADAHCQKLASAAGAGKRTWRAYLSTQGVELGDKGIIHARDRIGAGPWYNAKGVRVSRDVEDLHSARNNVTRETALDERGQPVNGRTEKPNRHDILTGSTLDGKAYPAGADMTCANWTSSTTGKARVGHHDRAQWNSAHDSQGCTQVQLRASGGDGLFYCFAAQ